MQIAGYLQTSLIEWPGKISSVIFTPGCNFRCPFCHNANLVDPQKIKKLPPISEKEVFDDLKKRKKWIDGVAITGGEPTLQPDLGKFLGKCKQLGFGTMLETNGSLFPALQCLLQEKLIDFAAMDYKAPLDKSYAKVVRKKDLDLDTIVQSMVLLMNSGIDFELRTTAVPGIHDEKTLVKMAKQLRGLTEELKNQETKELKWVLQNFQPKNCLDPEFNQKKPYSEKQMKVFLKAVQKIIPGTELRGQ